MALNIPFTDNFGNTANYIKINSDPIQDYTSYHGTLKISAYANASARNAGKLPVAETETSIQGAYERLDADGCIKNLKYDDCKDKSRSEMYALLKTKKIKICGEVVNLADAEDC